jgi:cyclophilin family peptidyl-prolyl cis-trans isomerase
VFLDLEMDGQPIGRVVLGLYGKLVPKTVENFRALCTGENGVDSDGHRLHYKGTNISRIAPGRYISGGDIINEEGIGGHSIYSRTFPDENFLGLHNKPGILAMLSFGRNLNSSQFYITVSAIPQMDKRNVVLGEVLEGMEVVSTVEGIGSDRKLGKRVLIVNSGEL